MTDNEKTKQLLENQQIMVIAVMLADGTPWATPVRIQHQDGNVFEWDSAFAAEHSKAIVENSVMAITLFQKTENIQVGLYARGKGELIEELKPGFGRYRFMAEQAWLNDETFVKREVSLK